jgi:Reverse transcriptase (RNA-dependent DNA polymerase)
MTIQILLSLAAASRMIVELVDMETTYLNPALQKFVHVEQPQFFELKNHVEYILLPNQALYGLSECGFQWAAMPHTPLKPLDCAGLLTTITSMSTISTSVRQQSSSPYMLMISSLSIKINWKSIHSLNKAFNIHSLGLISRFLSLSINRDGLHGEIHILQADYKRILKRFPMMDCNPVKTLAIAGTKLHIHKEEESTTNANLYR